MPNHTAPSELRLARALARDGDDSLAFRAYLGRWRLAEDRHFAEDETAAHADLVVDGAAETGQDRYERLWRPTPGRATMRVSCEDGVGR